MPDSNAFQTDTPFPVKVFFAAAKEENSPTKIEAEEESRKSLKEEIRSVLESQPHRKSLKILLLEILGFDFAQGVIVPEAPPAWFSENVKKIEVVAKSDDLRVFIVSRTEDSILTPDFMGRLCRFLRGQYPNIFLVVCDFEERDWTLFPDSASGASLPTAFPLFSDTEQASEYLTDLALRLDQDAAGASYLEVLDALEKTIDPAMAFQCFDELYPRKSGVLLNAHDRWIEEARRYPVMTPEEEAQRFKHLAKLWPVPRTDLMPPLHTDGHRVAQECILRNLRLVVWSVKNWCSRDVKNTNLELVDLFQEGIIGLMKAIQRFDPQSGNKFSTYATWWIRQSAQRYLDDCGRTVRIPVYMSEKIRRIMLEFEKTNNYIIEDQMVNIKSALGSILWKPISMEALRRIERQGKMRDSQMTFRRNMIDNIERKQVSGLISSELTKLNSKQKDVIALRFGLEGNKRHTLEEIGKMFDVSRERIRQIEQEAMEKLQHPRFRRIMFELYKNLE